MLCVVAIIVVYLNNTWVCTCDRVTVHWSPNNNTFEMKYALMPTYELYDLLVQAKPTRHRSIRFIQPKSKSIRNSVCVVAIVVYLNNTWVCNYDRVIVHSTPSNNQHQRIKNTLLIQTYFLFVQSQHDIPYTVPFISPKSKSIRSRVLSSSIGVNLSTV